MMNLEEDTLKAYFEDKAKVQKASSLWCQYSMLKSLIAERKNVDISKYTNLVAFLKRQSVGYRPTQSKFLTKQEIDTFLREADDNTYLLMKVVLIIGVAGACRSKELYRMRVDEVTDEGYYLRITIPSNSNRIHREFIIPSETINGVNPAEIIRKYINLRSPQSDGQRFFVAYRNGKCINLPVGVNTFGNYPKKIASFLGLPNPKSYTGFSFKKSYRHGSWETSYFRKGYQ